LARRAVFVAARVARRWEDGQGDVLATAPLSGTERDRVRRDILRTAELATEAVARFLITGQMPTADQERALAAPGKAPVRKSISLADLTKLYLTWRDTSMAVALEEAVRMGAQPAILEDAYVAIRAGADGAMVRMAREFDREHDRLYEELTEERARLAHMALHDPLTGLPNRTLLLDRLNHALRAAPRRGCVAVLFVDLDHFKTVNDLGGHSAGDAVLVTVGRRLSDVVRPADTVARMGGDEFVVLCEGLPSGAHEAVVLATRVGHALAFDYEIPDRSLVVAASIGVAVATEDDDPEAVLMRADRAMYRAKENGRGRFEVGLADDKRPAQGSAIGRR
jgi:diguanylate cyclase (GGDEF)-like protein